MTRPLRPAALAVALVLGLAACGSGSTSGDEISSAATSAPPATPVSTPASDPASVPALTPVEASVAPTSGAVPAGGDWDALVSASVTSSMVDRVEVRSVEVLGGSGDGAPWLRVGVVLHHCCAEPNGVVFPADQWSAVAGDGGQLRVDGPMCDANVVCSDAERRVTLSVAAPPVLTFDVFRDVGQGTPLAAGAFDATFAAVYEFEGGVLPAEPLPIVLRIDVTPAEPLPDGDTTPTATPLAPVTVVGGGLNVGTTPVVGFADDPAQLAELLARTTAPVDVGALGVDWPSQAAIVLTLGSDLCPPVLAGLTVDGTVVTPVFANAGYRECAEPYVPYAVIAAVDRTLLAGVTDLAIDASLAYDGFGTGDGSPSVAAVAASPPVGERTLTPIAFEFGEPAGSVALPARGEATTTVLADGTPVYVVRHHDGTVSALDPRGDAGGLGESERSSGLATLVRWTAATRTFLGSGAYDEYGRRLDGFRTSDLRGYATRVVDGTVEIGGPVPPPAGAPIAVSVGPPARADVSITPDAPMPLTDAVALPPGTTAWIDAAVVTTPGGAAVCAAADAGCPAGSPLAAGVAASPGAVNVYYGPLLATRTPDGFQRIAFSGGYGGSAV